MRRLKSTSSSRSWFESIQSVLTGQHTLNAGLKYPFPFDQLGRVTEEYITRYKFAKYSEDCTKHFRELLARQTFSDTTSRLATVIACLPFVSSTGAREIFSSNIQFHSNVSVTSSFPLYIRAIVVAFQASAGAVDEHEAKCAESLGKLASSKTTLFGHPLRDFLQHYVLLREGHLLIHHAIPQVLKRACERYAQELENYEKSNKWFAAFVDAEWLAAALNGSFEQVYELDGCDATHSQPVSSQLQRKGARRKLETTSPIDEPCELDATQTSNRTEAWVQRERIKLANQNIAIPSTNVTEAEPPRRRFTLRRDTSKASSHASNAPIPVSSEASFPTGSQCIASPRAESTSAQHTAPTSPSVSIAPTLFDLPLRQQRSDASNATRRYSQLRAPIERQPCAILDEYMQTWKTWGLWKPNTARIKRWSSLSEEHAVKLHDLLALEGRDSTGSGNKTLFEGLLSAVPTNASGPSILRHGKLRLECPHHQPRASLDQLFQSLELAQTIGLSAVGLFAHLCMQPQPDLSVVEAIETISHCEDPKISRAVYDLLTSNSKASQMTAITKLIPLLDESPALREWVFPHITSRINPSLRNAQDVLADQVEKGRPGRAVGMRIFEFGWALQETGWLKSYFDNSTRSFLMYLPSLDELNAIFKHRTAIFEREGTISSDRTSDFILSRLAGHGEVTSQTAEMVLGVTKFYHNSPDSDRHAVAMALSRMPHLDPNILTYCLDRLHTLPDWCVRDLDPILADNDEMSCVNLAALLVKVKQQKSIDCDALLQLFVYMLEPGISGASDFMGTLASGLSLQSWFQWASNLRELLFEDIPFFEVPQELKEILNWSERLTEEYMPALIRLSDLCSASFDLRWIVINQSSVCHSLLEHLIRNKTQRESLIEELLLSRLEGDGANAEVVCERLQVLRDASSAGLDACMAVIRRQNAGVIQVAEALATGWMKAGHLARRDYALVESLSSSLALRTAAEDHVEEAINFFTAEYLSLVDQANRFERIRYKLRHHNPERTKKLLNDLGVEDSSTLTSDASPDIPASLVNYVEMIKPGVYEMLFPMTHLRPVQRKALGLSNPTRMILIRLVVKGNSGGPEFCSHFHPDPHVDPDNHSHHPWRLADTNYQGAPDRLFCGRYTNRGLYQLNRAVWQLLNFDFQSLEATYASIQNTLDNLAQSCIVCATPLRQQSLRATTCSTRCYDMLKRADLAVRASDMLVDPQVTDLLLTCAQSAAATEATTYHYNTPAMNLLVDCPLAPVEATQALATFQPLSPMEAQTRVAQVANWGLNSGLFISWVSMFYRGFLVTATDNLRIPSLPGIPQFLLANASPEKERSFATHSPQVGTTILFHGTSLNRLCRILNEGLIVATQTNLMVHVSLRRPVSPLMLIA